MSATIDKAGKEVGYSNSVNVDIGTANMIDVDNKPIFNNTDLWTEETIDNTICTTQHRLHYATNTFTIKSNNI